ncbi:MAG TPA: alpha/beta hydrolase [Actinoplanes sp.]
MSLERAIHEVKAGDRILSYEIAGPADGMPVFLLHGTPGSSSGPRPRNIVLHRLGVKLVSYDRPGYGRSRRQPGRRVVDAAADVRLIAEHARIKRYAVVGRSGGGPHALAVAARNPDQVVAAAVLVSLAPATAPDLDWYSGMAEYNTHGYAADEVQQGQDGDVSTVVERIRVRAERIQRDPQALVSDLCEVMRSSDRRIVKDVGIGPLLTKTYAEALRDGPYGWIDDALAFRSNWGFEPSEIRVPVCFWHGEDDNFSPVAHTRWLADRVPHSQIQLQSGTAHFGALEILPKMLDWLKSMQEGRVATAPDHQAAIDTRLDVTTGAR